VISFVKFFQTQNIDIFYIFKYTENIALKLVQNLKKKMVSAQFLFEYSIMFMERIALYNMIFFCLTEWCKDFTFDECNEKHGIGLLEMFYNVPTYEECQLYCNITTHCNFFAFNRIKYKCYIYDQDDYQGIFQGCKKIYGPARPEIGSCDTTFNVRKMSNNFKIYFIR